MRGQRGADAVALTRRHRDCHGGEAAPGRAQPVEPCHPREVIGARHRRRRGRHHPRAHRDPRAHTQPARHRRLVQIDAHPHRRGIGRRVPAHIVQRHAHQPARRQRLDPRHRPADRRDRCPRQDRRRDPPGPPPRQRQPGRDQKPRHRQRHPGASAPPHRQRDSRDARCRQQRRRPSARVGQDEPRRRPHAQHHRNPQCQLVALALQPSFGRSPPARRNLSRAECLARGVRG